MPDDDLEPLEDESMDDDDSEDGNGAEADGYLFVSTGESCPQCEALDGTFNEVVPERPHEKCDCEIRFTRPGTRTSSTQCENEWDIEHVGNTHYGADGRGVITHWQITVTCWDGAVFDTIADVDHGDDPNLWDQDFETFEDVAWSELYDRAEEIAAQHCRADCEPPGVI